MPISDFEGLQGRSLAAVFDDAQGNSEWLVATATLADGGIPSFSRWVPGDWYSVPQCKPTDAVRQLVLALHTGEWRVEADGDHNNEYRLVLLPEGFWRRGWLLVKNGAAATLQALQCGRRVGPVYSKPRLVIPQADADAATVVAEPAQNDGQPGLQPTNAQIQKIIRDYTEARAAEGRPPNQDDAVQRVQVKYPAVSRDKVRDHYRVVTGRDKRDRGRRKL
jgi:hypothetical protein